MVMQKPALIDSEYLTNYRSNFDYVITDPIIYFVELFKISPNKIILRVVVVMSEIPIYGINQFMSFCNYQTDTG